MSKAIAERRIITIDLFVILAGFDFRYSLLWLPDHDVIHKVSELHCYVCDSNTA